MFRNGPGVDLGHKPPLLLRVGDHLSLGNSLLGKLRQNVVAYDDDAKGGRWREERLPQL